MFYIHYNSFANLLAKISNNLCQMYISGMIQIKPMKKYWDVLDFQRVFNSRKTQVDDTLFFFR